MPDTDSRRPAAEAPLAEGRCAYCSAHRDIHFTGRHYICARCWRDIFGEESDERR